MKIKVTSYSSQTSLFSSILFFILGAILFTKADLVLSFVSISLGIILTIASIIQYVVYSLEVKREERGKKVHLVGGAITLFLAIIFIFFHNIVEQFIRFIIGAWILFSGIMRLINCLTMSSKNKKFLPLLIVSILLMITGIYTIITEDIFLKAIGFIMMVYATIEIIGYIFYTKDTIESEEPGTTTLIVKEEIEAPKEETEEKPKTRKTKKIKDATKSAKETKKKTKKKKDNENEESK